MQGFLATVVISLLYSIVMNWSQPREFLLTRGSYDVQDLYAQKRCFITIPSFLNEGRLTAQEGMQFQKITSAQNRVENTIKQLEEYKH